MAKRHRFLLAALAAALLAPWTALAEPVGTFTKVEGNVDILRRSDIAAARVRAGDPVEMGDAVRTKRDGRAEIAFRDETVLQLAPETRITIDEYTFRGDAGRERGLIGLLRGKVRAIVSKLRASVTFASRTDSSFSVRTPTAIAGVKGTQFIIYYERGVTGAIFIDGEGFLYNPSRPTKVVPIRKGQASFVMGSGEAPLEAQPVADTFVAPHLKDMPGSALETIAPPPPTGDIQQVPPPAVILSNMTYGAMSDAAFTAGGFSAGPPALSGRVVLSDPAAQPAAPPGGAATLVPVTQTYPALLPTPVSLSVVIP